MIKVEVERENYQSVVVLTADETGVDGLVAALRNVQSIRALRFSEIQVSDKGGTALRLRYESQADREAREKREADAEAAYEADRAARAAAAKDAPPTPKSEG